MSRATTDLADMLHGVACQTLLDEIDRYRNAKDADGKPCPQPVPPQLLAQVLKFLKDNGIDSPVRAGKVVDALDGVLPDLEDVETEHLARC